jgi:hypothetical protein
MTTTKGFRTSARPLPQLRTPISRFILAKSPLKRELPGVLKGVIFGAHARQDRLEILES